MDSPVPSFHPEQLFGSRTRARLLGLFFGHPDRAFFVRELSRLVDAQVTAVRRELANLVAMGAIAECEDGAAGEKADPEGRKFYKVVRGFLLFEDLERLMQRAAVLMNRTLREDLEKAGPLDLLVLTGRFTDVAHIPTDMLVVAEIAQDAVDAAVTNFERDVGREVNYTLLTPEEFTYRFDVGDRFLSSVLGNRHVVLVDKNGVAK